MSYELTASFHKGTCSSAHLGHNRRTKKAKRNCKRPEREEHPRRSRHSSNPAIQSRSMRLSCPSETVIPTGEHFDAEGRMSKSRWTFSTSICGIFKSGIQTCLSSLPTCTVTKQAGMVNQPKAVLPTSTSITYLSRRNPVVVCLSAFPKTEHFGRWV